MDRIAPVLAGGVVCPSMTAGVVAGGGAGARSKCEIEREGLDQHIKLRSLEVIVAAHPVEHEDRPSNRAVEVDRS